MTFCAHLCQPSLPPATASLPSRPGSHACDRLGCSILGRAYPCPWHIKAPMREHEPRWRCFVDSPPSQTVDFHPTALALSVLITSLGRLYWEHGRHCSSTAASRTRCSQRAKCCQPPSPHQRMPPSSSLQPRQPGATPRPTPLPPTQPSCPVSRAAVHLGPPDAVALPDTLARGERPRPERRWTRCTHRHHTLAHSGAHAVLHDATCHG